MELTLASFGAGRGIYSLPEASLLSGVSRARIRHWFRGNTYKVHGISRHSPPVVPGDYPESETIQLGFLDLCEIRVIDRLREMGLSWKELRLVSRSAATKFGTSHPFATVQFKTDGQRLFADIVQDGEKQLTQLRDNQQVFDRVLRPLLRDIDFENDVARRWWPLGAKKRVVVDPTRAFGRPIGVNSGVPAEILAKYAERTSVQRCARWYDVDAAEVRDSIAFHRRFAA